MTNEEPKKTAAELQSAIEAANTKEKQVRRRMKTQHKKLLTIGEELVTLTKERAENAMLLAQLYAAQAVGGVL